MNKDKMPKRNLPSLRGSCSFNYVENDWPNRRRIGCYYKEFEGNAEKNRRRFLAVFSFTLSI